MYSCKRSCTASILSYFSLRHFSLVIPINLYTTMSSRGFVTYMGIGNCDLRIDLRQSDHLAEDAARIAREMEQDASILRHTSLITKAFPGGNAGRYR